MNRLPTGTTGSWTYYLEMTKMLLKIDWSYYVRNVAWSMVKLHLGSEPWKNWVAGGVSVVEHGTVVRVKGLKWWSRSPASRHTVTLRIVYLRHPSPKRWSLKKSTPTETARLDMKGQMTADYPRESHGAREREVRSSRWNDGLRHPMLLETLSENRRTESLALLFLVRYQSKIAIPFAIP